MGIVTVEYDNFYKDSENVQSIEFELIEGITLRLEEAEGVITMTMVDTSTEETELTGTLDEETLNNLIRSLNILKLQLQ